jgi:hypothetical protein
MTSPSSSAANPRIRDDPSTEVAPANASSMIAR